MSATERSGDSKKNKWRLALSSLALLVVVVAAVALAMQQSEKGPPIAAPAATLTAAEPLLSRLPIEHLEKRVEKGKLPYVQVEMILFSRGRRVASAWGKASQVADAIALASEEVHRLAAERSAEGEPDTALVTVATRREKVSRKSAKKRFSNVHRGVVGLGIASDGSGEEIWVSPVETIYENRPPLKELDGLAKRTGLTVNELYARGRIFAWDAKQYHVPLSGGQVSSLLRGNVLIRPQEVTAEALTEFRNRLSRWMVNNVDEDGRMVYKYWPSNGKESTGNNTIRQWMASVCLGRIAADPDLPVAERGEARAAADRNLGYNIKAFYRERDGLGSIEWGGSSKLGAAALALLAIVESPIRRFFTAEEAALTRTLQHLWQPSGELRTFLVPKDRNDNHNFYPGETLLTWASLYRERGEPQLLEKFLKSYEYYRAWHLENRNPAFVPWHTQAYYMLWHDTRDPRMPEWIFEMNDWLLEMQARSLGVYEDTRGRFYDPKRPKYGPPHASSTGVYLEGLIDAFALAKEQGDSKRQAAYRKAILLGLRHAMQLEFADEIDMFYVSKRERVHGGLRTTVYNNEIRVDNIQHVLMAVQKIRKVFTVEDFRIDFEIED